MGMTCSLHLASAGDIEQLKSGKLGAKDFLTKVTTDPTSSAYLDKAWQIIHFGLSGEEWDCNDLHGAAVMGGEDFMGGHSLERLLDQNLAASVAGVLEPIGEAEFKDLLLSRDLNDAELYCFDPNNLEEDANYAAQHYGNLRSAYLRAAQEGCGVVVSIS